MTFYDLIKTIAGNIQKHWKGELSIGPSFLLNQIWQLSIVALLEMSILSVGVPAPSFAVLIFRILIDIIFVWWCGGVLSSYNNLKKENNKKYVIWIVEMLILSLIGWELNQVGALIWDRMGDVYWQIFNKPNLNERHEIFVHKL